MSVSAYATVFYGAPVPIKDLFERKTVEQTATCHPDEIEEGDTFCSVCGQKTVTVEETWNVAPKFRGGILPEPYVLELGPDLHPSEICEWIEGGIFDAFWDEFGRPDRIYLGRELLRKGDLMYGDECNASSFSVEGTQVEDMRSKLTELGFEPKFYLQGQVY